MITDKEIMEELKASPLPRAPKLQWTKDGFISSAGIRYSFNDAGDGKNYVVQAQQDVYEMLELNKAMFNENNGWNWGKTMRRAASIPTILRNKWLIEEGWDAWRPDLYWDQIKRKLNSSDYRYLRTAEWRL